MAGTKTGDLDGKVAIVTGAGRGLGRAMTLGLLDAGARVAAVELDAPAIEETQDAVEDRGAAERFIGIGADVTHDESGAKILRVTAERFGRLDILINNAGISTGLLRGEDQPVGKLWETTPGEFRRVVDVNVIAPFLMTRAVLPDAAGAALGSHHQRHDQS
jgi:3-oxoacyl-[acyl-carrier protein] reductase